MTRKHVAQTGINFFYEYGFRAQHTLAVKWSSTGTKLGWLTSDDETCFLHVWNRVEATYDAIEVPQCCDFSFDVDKKYVSILGSNSKIYKIDLDKLDFLDVIDSKVPFPRFLERSPNGDFVAVVSDRGHIRVFDTAWKVICETSLKRSAGKGLPLRAVCKGVSWHPNSTLLAFAGNGATVLNISSFDEVKYLTEAGLYDVAWSPDGKWLSAATAVKTIVIWNVESNILYRVLEGHRSEVKSLCFSADGNLLASQSLDGRVMLWNCADWSSVEVNRTNVRSRSHGRRLAFHPTFSWLAHTEKLLTRSDKLTLLLSELDVQAIKRNVSIPTVTYASAKIVLVGESGAGKTGLGWRIANNSFKEHPSTHGQQFWLTDQLSSIRDDGTQCEAVLWDLAGQPDYRLIHALFLDDVDVALVLFDPTKVDDPLHGVEYWLKQLSRRQIIDKRTSSPPVILVAARIDRGISRLSSDEIEAFCTARELSGYFSTSATTGEGLPELIQKIRNSISWKDKPATVTTETFKKIKDHVLRLKETPNSGHSIVTLDELRRQLRSHGMSADFSKDELLSAIGHLTTHGYVAILRSSKGDSRILLIPELLNNLAASIVLEARRNLRGLGSLDEQHLLESEKAFGELVDLSSSERSVLLNSTVSMLLQNNICYRETDPLNSKSYLVFPELINLKKPPFDDNVEVIDDVSYSVSGAIANVYASLVVLLGYTDRFTRTHQWRDHARYEFGDGMICGFRLENEQEGELNFVLYFGAEVKATAKSLFVSLFENFLASRDVTVQRYIPVRCSRNHVVNRNVIKEQFYFRVSYAYCSRCGEKVNLPEQNETIQLTLEESRTVEYEERTARQRSLFEKAVFLLKSYALQKGLSVPTCFISYAWGEIVHERWVERLANDLINAGVTVVFDRWDNEKIGASVPRFVERALGADKVILVGTPTYRTKYQNNDSMNSYIVAAEGDIIGARLIGSEEEKTTVMPILLDGTAKTSFPDLLQGRVYGDFRDGEEYTIQMIKLLSNIYEIKPREKIIAEIMKIFETE
jgi:small GTP-binding protein